MRTKFAVLNPIDGSYTQVTTEQERDVLLAQNAWNFFLSHTHNRPFSIVTINEDGSETWSSPTGEPILSPAQFEELIGNIAK